MYGNDVRHTLILGQYGTAVRSEWNCSENTNVYGVRPITIFWIFFQIGGGCRADAPWELFFTTSDMCHNDRFSVELVQRMWSEFSKVMFATSTWSKTLTASFSMSIVVFRRTIFSQHLRPISYLLSQHLRPTVSCIVDTVRGYMWIFGK